SQFGGDADCHRAGADVCQSWLHAAAMACADRRPVHLSGVGAAGGYRADVFELFDADAGGAVYVCALRHRPFQRRPEAGRRVVAILRRARRAQHRLLPDPQSEELQLHHASLAWRGRRRGESRLGNHLCRRLHQHTAVGIGADLPAEKFQMSAGTGQTVVAHEATQGARQIAISARAMALVVAGITFLAYVGTLGYEFVYDDRGQIVNNPFIKSWHYLPRYFTDHVWGHVDPTMLGNYY